jgi:hypothetical protein
MICENLQNLNYESIIINEPIKNSAVQYNYFYKLLYSTNIVTLTSIFVIFELNNLSYETDKIKFDKSAQNNTVFNKLIELEDYVLNLIRDPKTKLFKLKELYENQFFKYTLNDDTENLHNYNYVNEITNSNPNSNANANSNSNANANNSKTFIIKISGIWESKDSIGLTFKFIKANKFIEFI